MPGADRFPGGAVQPMMQLLLARLDQMASPIFLHRELQAFPAGELAEFVSEGLLLETSRATQIPRPSHVPVGGDLIVRQTSRGLFGVADEDDYFDPIPLGEDDVRQYEVSVSRLAARIRRENDINGIGFKNHNGLIPLGQKTVDALGTIDVYLSLPNQDESVLLSRCQRLERPVDTQRILLMSPCGMSLSPEGRRVIDSTGMILVFLAEAAKKGSLALNWSSIASRPGDWLAEQYPRDRCIFTKRGKTWLVVYDGISRSVGDSKGMAYIQLLLQNPHQDTHAAAMRGAAAGEEDAHLLGSAGEVLDQQALREYKDRVSELHKELAKANDHHDLGRQNALNEELQIVLSEVARATGLHGQKREASSDRERARQSVSTAIHRALRAIKKEHQPLWQHLENSLKIGEFLSYQPDKNTSWTT